MSDKTLKFTNEYANSGTQKPHVFCLAMMFIIFYFCLTWLNTHMVNDSNFYLYKILTSRYQLKRKTQCPFRESIRRSLIYCAGLSALEYRFLVIMHLAVIFPLYTILLL